MKDDRRFQDVVKSIVSAEADVDAILEAARLTRNETDRRMTGQQKYYLLLALIGLGAVIALLCLMALPCIAKMLRA